ncbi:MAG: hypothetical protein WCT49_00035 [Candidatus Paceibacterota bacterium]|nr:hypothetical protein [Candidatus Paceibacterota bacterium]
MRETIRRSVSTDEISAVVYEILDQEYFILRDLVNKLELAYHDKEVNTELVRAYLSQMEQFGLVEESRSGVGLDKKYWCHKPTL